jgi:outer membrane protein assembly factor BamB
MGNSVLIEQHLYGFDGTAHRGRPVELACISAINGSKKWSTQEYKYGSVIASGKDLIVLTESGEILIGPASQDGFQPQVRRQILEGRCWTPPALANGRIYARNAAGKVVVLEIKTAN